MGGLLLKSRMKWMVEAWKTMMMMMIEKGLWWQRLQMHWLKRHWMAVLRAAAAVAAAAAPWMEPVAQGNSSHK